MNVVLLELRALLNESKTRQERMKAHRVAIKKLQVQKKKSRRGTKRRAELERRLTGRKEALAKLKAADDKVKGKGKKAAAKKKKAPAAGSQLEPDLKKKLDDLGVVDWPRANVPREDIKVIDLNGPDIHDRAVMVWTDKFAPPNPRTGKPRVKFAYTEEHQLKGDKKKFATAEKLLPKIDKHRSDFVRKMKNSATGSRDEAGNAISAVMAWTGLRTGGPDQLFRVDKEGNPKPTFGLTTIRKKHVKVLADNTIKFEYLGKGDKINTGEVRSKALADVFRRRMDGKGDDDEIFPEINRTQLSGYQPPGVKNKDWRTVVATEQAVEAVENFPPPPPPLPEDPEEAKELMRNAVIAISTVVAEFINNTPNVSRDSYISPRVFRDWTHKIGFTSPLRDLGFKRTARDF